MSNRAIHIEKLFCDQGFCIALREAFRSTPSPYGLAYYLHVDPEDVTWDVYPVSAKDVAVMKLNPRSVIARNPSEVEPLRQRLAKALMSSPEIFSVSLPDFTPIRLPWDQITPEYLDAINRLEGWAETPICLGDLDPNMKIQRQSFMPHYGLTPLADRMLGRIFDAGLTLREMVGSTLIYEARRGKGQELTRKPGPDGLMLHYEWAVRATIEIERAEDIWITDLSLISAYSEQQFSSNGALPFEVENARSKWTLEIPEVTRRISAIRMFNMLHIRHDEDITPLIAELSARIARANKRALETNLVEQLSH